MITQELINEAKRRYPVGTQLKECLMGWLKGPEKGIVRQAVHTVAGRKEDTIWLRGNHYSLCVYKDGVWAKTVNDSSQEYEIF